MLYVEPALVQRMLGGQPCLVPGGLSDDPRLRAAAEPLLRTMSQPLDPLEEADALYDLAQALATVAGQRGGRRAFDYGAAERARLRIHDGLAGRLTLADLKQPAVATAGACRAISARCTASAPIAMPRCVGWMRAAG